METKTIPFDLETAKKIQAGEVAGTIKTKNGLYCKIVSYCDGTDFFVERTTETRHFRWCYPYTKDGRYLDGKNNGGTDYDLILEMPDTHQFNVGDKVRVRPKDTHSHFVNRYDNCIGKIVGTHHEYFMVIVKGAFQDLFLAEELELVNKTGKHKFKPFDKVLVRDGDNFTWKCGIFSHIEELLEDHIFVVNSGYWHQCIPYEGNEHLIGTTDKPTQS